MNLAWAVSGAVIGALAGAAMSGPVFRMSVPSGEPDRVGRPQRRGRPAHSVALPAVTAAVVALLCGRLGGQPVVAAFGFLGVLGVALSAIDIAVHRLPDRLTLPGYPVLAGLLAVAAIAGHDGWALARALLGGLTLGAGYLLLAIAGRGQLGGGDVKLAGLVGLALGWIGWPAVIMGTALAFLLSALVSLALLAARRMTLRSSICFGPFMLGGAVIIILISGT